MKNIVFIPFINRTSSYTTISGIGKLGRTDGYEYGIDSWKQWCKKHDCELVIMDQLLMPESEMLITWQRWCVLDILEHNEIEYDQVLVVDADSIVHPDCPNFFELTDNKFSSPLTDGDYEWVCRAINGYSKMFFNKEYCFRYNMAAYFQSLHDNSLFWRLPPQEPVAMASLHLNDTGDFYTRHRKSQQVYMCLHPGFSDIVYYSFLVHMTQLQKWGNFSKSYLQCKMIHLGLL